ncbi:unnamed protein product [Sphagnum jensenii]|uniref:ZC3H15/TMA46 family C-terminal domain-containing protein n=1 Tax=Sphagnum jensenii TaxID=128206 RepID=A0ABP1BLA9_9BRYO
MGAPAAAAAAAPPPPMAGFESVDSSEGENLNEQTPATAAAPCQITPLQFQLWKRQKDAEAAAKAVEAAQKRAEDIAAGRVRMNGRELYQKEPWVFDDSRFE